MKDPIRQPELERCFATGLRVLRQETRLNQIEFAQKLTAAGRPVSPAWVSWLESGRNRVTLADAMLIADVFGTDVASVIERGKARRKLLAQASGRWPA